MIVVLSGEGRSDLGVCDNAQGNCVIPDFFAGPMTLIIDKMIEEFIQYSILGHTPDRCIYVHKTRLAELDKARKENRRNITLPSKKHNQETGYFYINAWMLGMEAIKLEEKMADKSIAILFRDCDGTNSTSNGLWHEKYQSILSGFKRATLENRGVPMLPKPKSEAWLLCAAKDQPYAQCEALEDLPGNDDAPCSVKSLLQSCLEMEPTAENVNRWIEDHGYDHHAVAENMPSFNAFKSDLISALTAVRRLAVA